MYDLAISDHGDLILAGSRDLEGVSGTNLLDQRIVIRLRIPRGSWYYDTDETLGSFLFRVLGSDPNAALEIDTYVREALRAMPEISVEEVQAIYNEDAKSMVITVAYTQTLQGDEADIDLPGGDTQAATVTIPFVMGE
jgi:hypothetical protein